ncbi:MAG: isoaspartyl peptidase/L-asparaginase family protein [Polyangiales bacterium]
MSPSSRRVSFGWGSGPAEHCILVHGGAGARLPGELEPEVAGCAKAAEIGAAVLRAGGSALDAVQRAVECLEDDPRFNAGTGGALTEQGTLELDASIMDGALLRAGAVCCLSPHRHPIAVARAALEDGRHVLYAGAGADAFARSAGLSPEDPQRMISATARERLQRALAAPGRAAGGGNTVGAVARDRHGHLAAATSTGGITGKRTGRVGDSPLIGAGTYADDARGAASATGQGEGIIRVVLCASAVALLGTGSLPEQAARSAVEMLSERAGCEGGIILIAADGSLGLARSSAAMPFASASSRGQQQGG